MGVYKNSTELMNLSGIPIYMNDLRDACLIGGLNLFLQGDTGSGKTQLAVDTMAYFPGKSMFILGRNDMDVRELFQQINLDKLKSAKSSAELKELTDKIDNNLIIVDELPNCVSAVRAQLFNLFDGYIELNGKKHDIGKGRSVGIATGNIGQKFTESSNELGRALKDRMHIIVDTDYFKPTPFDTLEILDRNRNPRVEFTEESGKANEIIAQFNALKQSEVSFEKLIVANYLVHGLDYCVVGNQPASKTKMKDAWPNNVDNHGKGSDEALVLPVSMRAAKSIITLSQALDKIARSKGAGEILPLESMMQAYKFVSAYSGILNEAAVMSNYNNDRYAAMDAVIALTQEQFRQRTPNIASGLEMLASGKPNKEIFDRFTGRWEFMQNILGGLLKNNHTK